jgi:transcriptional regulator with XRE-family HTH domain
MKFRTALGEVIRETRQELGVSMREVAEKGCMALGYLSEIERGRKEASSEILECISVGLGISVSKLIEKTTIRIRFHEPLDVSDFEFDELELVG